MLPEEGQVLTGPQFSEPMRVETVRADGPSSWVLGVVGIKTERFRRVALTAADLAQITIQSATLAFDGDPADDVEDAFTKIKNNEAETILAIAGALTFNVGAEIADRARSQPTCRSAPLSKRRLSREG
jgi:hypothetical protein